MRRGRAASRGVARPGPLRQPAATIEDPALPATLDAATRARLLAAARPLRAPAGTVLFRPGEACAGFVLLRAGQVRVDLIAEDGHALLLYRVAPGEACALTTACLFAGEAYSAEGRAETALDGLMLPRAAFESLAAESAGFRRFVLAGFGARLAALMARIEELSFRSVDSRLAAWLLARATAAGSGTPGPGPGPGSVSVPATQSGIAEEVGTAREVVTRRLAAFARAGLVRPERGAVAILDPAGLRRIAEGDSAAV